MSRRKGDTDPKAWAIAIVGGVIGGLLGRSVAGLIAGAYLPTIIYQLGLPLEAVHEELGLGESQLAKGFSRAFVAVFASMIPATVAALVVLLAGWLLSKVLHWPDGSVLVSGVAG